MLRNCEPIRKPKSILYEMSNPYFATTAFPATVLISNGLEGAIQEVAIPILKYRHNGMGVVTMEMPGTFAYVYLGTAAAGAATAGDADSARTIVQIAGAVAALVVTIFVARLATKAIQEAGVEG